jgi:hypothetical protein
MRLGRRPCLRISESGAKTPSTDGDYPVRYFACNDCGVPCFYPHGLGTVPLGAWERVVHSVGHQLTCPVGNRLNRRRKDRVSAKWGLGGHSPGRFLGPVNSDRPWGSRGRVNTARPRSYSQQTRRMQDLSGRVGLVIRPEPGGIWDHGTHSLRAP